MFDQEDVRPDGLTVRRLRHERGWSPRKLVDAISAACLSATGLRSSISPNVLMGIEEHNERVPYETVCLVAAAFDCDPVDLVLDELEEEEEDELEGSARG